MFSFLLALGAAFLFDGEVAQAPPDAIAESTLASDLANTSSLW